MATRGARGHSDFSQYLRPGMHEQNELSAFASEIAPPLALC
jgi:hypothetical protein